MSTPSPSTSGGWFELRSEYPPATPERRLRHLGFVAATVRLVGGSPKSLRAELLAHRCPEDPASYTMRQRLVAAARYLLRLASDGELLYSTGSERDAEPESITPDEVYDHPLGGSESRLFRVRDEPQ